GLLMFNSIMQVSMQFTLLLTGALVFVFFLFEPPPLLFDRAAREVVEFTAEYRATEARYQQAFAERRDAAQALLASRDAASRERYRSAQKQLDTFRAEGAALARVASGRPYNDTNHIFL